jgi:hypothetical protein
MQPPRFDTDVFKEIFQEDKFSSGIVITFQVMAVTRVSPGHPHAIRSMSKGGQNELRAHSTRAGNPYDPEIGRVLKTADTG